MTELAETSRPAKPDAPQTSAKHAAARDRRILNALVAGVNGAELARREGVSVRRMQQLTKAIFARRRDAVPDDFVALQVTRLQEALIVSYAAMGGGNLKAVDRFVRIVRELDRYHGYAATDALRPGEKTGAKQNGSQVFDKMESGKISRALALTTPAVRPLDLAVRAAEFGSHEASLDAADARHYSLTTSPGQTPGP